MTNRIRKILIGCAALGITTSAFAQTTVNVGVNPASPWQGFMNVFELPQNGGAYVFQSAWGVPDLTATFQGGTLTLGPNSVDDPSSFWYTPSGGPGSTGNKITDANIYVEVDNGSLSGQTVTFSGTVLSNTFISGYSTVAFIKDFSPDFSSSINTAFPLIPGQQFSISLSTIPDPTRHVQYGFETKGPDVWITDRAPIGTAVVTTIPGDFNQDGILDTGDVTAMMNVLSNSAGFATANGLTADQLTMLGDLNGDGQFNNADVQALISDLGSLPGSGSLSAVPEPSSGVLLVIGGLMLWRRKAR